MNKHGTTILLDSTELHTSITNVHCRLIGLQKYKIKKNSTILKRACILKNKINVVYFVFKI